MSIESQAPLPQPASQRELLQRVGEAAGLQLKYDQRGFSEYGKNHIWDPLTNAEDALQVALKLRLQVTFGNGTLCVSGPGFSKTDNLDADGVNLRLAIVHVAYAVAGQPR